ncbi:TOBE domain-containing protein [Sulfurospirillum halorespirans]|uniref:TOBE domain protein n=1 Tax=Sulfurospirillum halorespirans DSM 13726 TaxID=1193502 RepID=A0A1D7TLS2_9BACT|nr:TOBE domain-containing protein [Sulfurospirillum halorespirans]AOO65926.1 TOBE domain protein [Sulfurospirillum halorespirans DSM 13726]
MNRLNAVVTHIEGEQNLHIISFDYEGVSLKMMGLDLPKGLHVNAHVTLGIKPSHVAIAKNLQGELSYSNQLSATIESIENGKLLSNILLHVKGNEVQSFITLGSSTRMNLQKGDEVTLLLKASELFVLEVLDA